MKYQNFKEATIICNDIARLEESLQQIMLPENSVEIDNRNGFPFFRIAVSGGNNDQTEEMLKAAKDFRDNIAVIYEKMIQDLKEKLETL